MIKRNERFETMDGIRSSTRSENNRYQVDYSNFLQDLESMANPHIYSSEAKMTIVRLALSHATINGWEMRELDVPTMFLNG